MQLPALCFSSQNKRLAARIACLLLQGAALLSTVLQPPAQSGLHVEQLLQGAMPLEASPELASALPDTSAPLDLQGP